MGCGEGDTRKEAVVKGAGEARWTWEAKFKGRTDLTSVGLNVGGEEKGGLSRKPPKAELSSWVNG